MGNLFDDDRILGRWGVTRTQQTVALGSVFTALDADSILVIEGLGSNAKHCDAAALECLVAQLGIRARRLVIRYVNNT